MVISNATPLIAFARIDQLSLLRRVVGDLVIPGAVADEISGYTRSPAGSIDLLQEQEWIKVHSIQSEAQGSTGIADTRSRRSRGHCVSPRATSTACMIDELTGRKVAESLNLSVVGSVGILIRAKQLGEILAVKPHLDEMKRQGIYFSQRFIDAVLREVQE